MQAGLLNEIIDLFKPEITTNEYGEQVQTYRKVRETKAQVLHNSGNRETNNSEIFYSYSKTFKIRRYIEVCENYQICYQKKMYRIISIEDNRKYNEKTIEAELINE